MTLTISCPGKIILMGEHAVVWGKPAIVAAINKRMTVTLKNKNGPPFGGFEISAKSEIPVGGGMGSSAALAVVSAASFLASVQDKFKLNNQTRKMINEIAYEREKINHGNPSGVDNTVATFGGVLWFKKKMDGSKIFKKLAIKKLPNFVLINTGRPKETTREMVQSVKAQISNVKSKSKILNLFNQIEKATREFLRAIETEDKTFLKNSIRTCERNLEKLGVVGKLAKRLVREIERIGGVAKITGAGGKASGSGMLLCYHENPEKIIELGEKFKLETLKVKLGEEGLTVKASYE